MNIKNLEFLGYSKYSVNSDSEVFNVKTGRKLKQFLCGIKRAQYFCVKLYNDEGSKTFKVHRLVVEAFVSAVPEGLCVNHKDGNKLNNTLSNLEIVSYSENTQHAKDTGLAKRILSEEQVVSICKTICNGFRLKDTSKIHNVKYEIVMDIFRRKSYSKISEKYDMEVIPRKERLSVDRVHKLCKMLQDGYDYDCIIELHGYSSKDIYYIKNRERYSEISINYRW